MRDLLIVTHNFPPAIGGIEQLCGQLARALHASGTRVRVIAPELPESERFDAQEPYPVVRTGHAFGGGVQRSLAIQHYLQRGYDAVLCMQWTSAFAVAARRRAGLAPRTLGIIGHGKDYLPSASSRVPEPLRDLARKQTLAQATHAFGVSAFTAELMREHGGVAHPHILHPGVDITRFSPANALAAQAARGTTQGPCLLTVARLVPRKGVDTVITALPALAARFPQLRYWVVGDGPDRPRLLALAHELGVQDRVEFRGAVPHDQLLALYTAADVFVLPSRHEGKDVEGFGLVLLEAQACGTPVIGAQAGGVPDAFVHGQTGLLVTPDDPQDLARVAGELLSDAALRERMSDAALAHARDNSWHAVAQRLRAILQTA